MWKEKQIDRSMTQLKKCVCIIIFQLGGGGSYYENLFTPLVSLPRWFLGRINILHTISYFVYVFF